MLLLYSLKKGIRYVRIMFGMSPSYRNYGRLLRRPTFQPGVKVTVCCERYIKLIHTPVGILVSLPADE